MVESPDGTLMIACEEPEGAIVRQVKLAELTMERMEHYYEKLSPFKTLFNDFIKNDLEAFIKAIITINRDGTITPRGLIWEVDDVGLICFSDIHPGHSATFHPTFWDRRIRGREQLMKDMIKYVMILYELRRVSSIVPVYNKPTMAAAERVGFSLEGRLREFAPYEGQWFDANLYSILRKELSE